MNLPVNQYQLDKLIGRQDKTELFLAVRKEDKQKVILKFLQQASARDDLRAEFEILQRLEHPGIIKSLALDAMSDKPILVYEYFDGVPLKKILKNKSIALSDFFLIAIKIAQALSVVHDAEIIHCDLNPSNILIQPQQKNILLIGFSRALIKSQGSFEEVSDLLVANQKYSAPEQSGRMNWAVDYRTDIYSLGIVFYQMLSGRCPFDSKDSIGLMHDHIAKIAPLLSDLELGIPTVVSRIIDKMIAKNPADRYQSLLSLIADLQICQAPFDSDGEIYDFELGKISNSEQAFISGKLYGREAEINQLGLAFDKACVGPSVLALLKGESGVGKSSIVDAAKLQYKNMNGYCLTTKFDQFKRHTPFEMLHSALRVLVRTLLSKNEQAVLIWGQKILTALAGNAQLIIDIIPEVEILIGPQTAAQELPPAEAKIRLNRLVNQFIQVFCLPEQPLCLFLDDLQWADDETIEWLESALFNISHLLIIAAYRTNEATQRHDLPALLKKLEIQGGRVVTINVDSFPKSVVTEMLVDNMNLEERACDDLVTAVFNKTQGNPFFITQYFQQLQEDGSLWFEPVANHWQYDINKILSSKINDNVVEHLSQRITSLSAPVQDVLKIAACIGNQFDSEIIQRVTEQDENIMQYIDTAVSGGWIVNDHQQQQNNACQSFVFSHDRIQQAVWLLLSPQQVQQVSLKVGRYMLEQDAINDNEYLMQTANHLNSALPLIINKDEQLRLGGINFNAGLAAKQTGAFELALSYIQTAMEIFSDSLDDKGVHAALIRERAECEHLCGNNSQAKKFYEQAALEAPSIMEKAYLYELMIQFYTDMAQFEKAYSISRTAMQMFEINLPAQFNPLLFASDFIALKFQLRHFKTLELLDLPQATDAKMDIIIRLLSATLKVAYQIKPELCVAISAKLLRLCLKYGNTREAVVGYMVFGVIFVGGVMGNHATGYEYGQLSLALLDKYNNDRQRAEVNFVYGYFANSWAHPASDTEQYWNTSYKKGLEVGDWFHTSCAYCSIIQSLFMRGIPLQEVVTEAQGFLYTLDRIGGQEQAGAIRTVIQSVKNLQGETESSTSFRNAEFNEDTFIDSLKSYGSRHFAHYYFINKMQCLYFQGQYISAYELSQRSAEFLNDSAGMLHSVEHYFYTALTLAMLYPQANSLQRFRSMKVMKWTEKKLKLWAQQCNENFIVRQYLVSAEILRLKNEQVKALACYELAIQQAEKYGQLHLKSLANEMLARLCDKMNLPTSAFYYQNEAVSCYRHWGANVYQQRLVIEKGMLSRVMHNASDSKTAEKTSLERVSTADTLDIVTLIKSAEVIAKQRRLPELLQTLISIVIENAGAQRGVLLLQESNELIVQAEATFEANQFTVLQQTLLSDFQAIPHSIINYVSRTQASVAIDNVANNSIYSQDEDVINRQVLSVLCAPLMMLGELKGIIYLENNATEKAFSEERLTLLQHLSGQIVISIDNALIYQNLENKVLERTHDIETQKQALVKNNTELENQNSTILMLNTQLQEENQERHKAEKELHLVNKQLKHLTVTDALTQISNRRHFDNYLHQECARLTRVNALPLALILCDIDYFKLYNDSYGHQAGDDCLFRVAQALLKVAKRPSDLAARYGGEEFVIVIPQADIAGVKQVAEQIHKQIALLKIPHKESNVAKYITLSIGITIAKPKDTSNQPCSPEQLIKVADDALYQVKENGRNATICVELE